MLLSEKKRIDEAAERRRLRDEKKFGKKAQVAKKQVCE